MAITTTEEALTFIKTNRMMFEKKTGFKHYSLQLKELEEFIEKLAAENEKLKGEK